MPDVNYYLEQTGLLHEKKQLLPAPGPEPEFRPIPMPSATVDEYLEGVGLETSPMHKRRTGAIPELPGPEESHVSLMRLLAASEDPVKELAKINATKYLAQTFKLDPAFTYSNLESLSQYWLGKIVPPEVFAQSLRNAWDNGIQNYEISKLALRLRESGGRDEELLKQIAELEANMKPLSDIPRPWIQNALLWAMESTPLMAQSFLHGGAMGAATGAAAGLALASSPPGLLAAGATKGMSIPAITLSMASVGFVVGSTQEMIQVNRGLSYWRMLQEGVPHNIAAPLSDIEGVISGSIESLGNILIGVKLPGLTPALKSAGTLIANKMMASGAVSVIATRIASQAVGAALGEGIEEPLQELTAIFTDQLARELTKNKELVDAFGRGQVQPDSTIPAITFQQAIERMGQAFYQGMSAGLIFGLVGTPAGVRADVSRLAKVQELAASMPTRSVFVDTVIKGDLFPETAVGDKRLREYLGKVWETQQERRATEVKAEPKKPSLEIVRPEAAKGYRTEQGLIFTETRKIREIKEGTSEIIKAGDPTTGERYGYISYEKVGDSLYIDQVVNDTDQDIRRELILDLASKNPRIEIEWNPTEEADIELKESLISQNPRGTQYGLQWFDQAVTTETERGVPLTRDLFVRGMAKTFDVPLEEAEYYGELSDIFAKNEGLPVNEWLSKYIAPEVAIPIEEAEAQLRAGGAGAGVAFRTREGEYVRPQDVDLEAYKGQVKAVFAALGEQDFHIGVHEFFHAVERLALSPEQVKLFEDAIGELRGKWTETDIEKLADRFEDYLATGKAPTPVLEQVFKEISALLDQLVSFIKERMGRGPFTLSPEFQAAYDALFVKPDSGIAIPVEEEAVELDMFPGISVPATVQGDLLAPEVSPPDPPPTTTIFDISAVPVVEVPVADISLSQEVPNFKEGVSAKGVIEPLAGKGYQRLGTAPIVLWERLSGRLEVITGRHRLDLAQRAGEATIPAQIVKESEGFTAAQAMTFDAESNIRDGQGSVRDYANYFRNTDSTEEQASGRGLLARDKGRKGYAIGTYASNSLYTLYRNKKIAEGKAAAIAATALGDERLQDLGILRIKELKAEELVNYLTILKNQGPTLASGQVDLFGQDESFMTEAAIMAKEAAKKMNELRSELNALRGALRLSKGGQGRILQKYGFTSGDVDAVQVRLTDLELEIFEWSNWTTDSEKHEELRKRSGLIPGLLFHRAPPVESKEFKLWFGNSTVVEIDGSPKTMYHGTRGGFEVFRRGDMGMHFGTITQATAMAGRHFEGEKGPAIFPVYIRLQNPIRLRDLGNWQPAFIVPQLIEAGAITQQDIDELKAWHDVDIIVLSDDEIIALLKSKGYDGISYLNRREGILKLFGTGKIPSEMTDEEFLEAHPEAEESVMVFNPTQIKSVYNRGSWGLAQASILFHPMEIENVAGYRYGRAHGKSYNTRESRYEIGVSMASIAGLPESRSFATMSAKESREKIYYIGTVIGKGGDDEYLMGDIKEIGQTEYEEWGKNNKKTTAGFVNEEIKDLKWLMEYSLSHLTYPSEGEIKKIKKRYTKKINELNKYFEGEFKGIEADQMLFHPADRWQEEFLYGTRIDYEIYENYVRAAKGYESAAEYRAAMEQYTQLIEGDIAGEEVTEFYEEVWNKAHEEKPVEEPVTVPIKEPVIEGQEEYDYGEKQKVAKDIPDDIAARRVEVGKITEEELGKVAETTEKEAQSVEEQVATAETETTDALLDLTPEDQRIIALGDQVEAAINGIEAMPAEAEKPTQARVNLQAKIDSLRERFEAALRGSLVLAETLLKETIWTKALITGEQVPGEEAVAAASKNYKEAVRLARDLQKEIDERRAKKVAKTTKEKHAESRAKIYAKKRTQLAAFKKKLADAKKTRRALKKYKEAKQKLIRDIIKEPGRSISFKGYAETIREIQRGLDPINRQKRTIYSREQSRQFFDENPEAAALVPKEKLEKIYSVPLAQMTLEQLEEIDDMIVHLRKFGRLKRSLELIKEKRLREAERAEAESTVLRGKEPIRPVGGVKPTKRGLKALLPTWKPSRVALLLDGVFEGGKAGVFTRWIQDEPNKAWSGYQKSIRSRMTPVLKKMEELKLTMDPLDVRRTTKGFSFVGDPLDINGFKYDNGKRPTVNDAMYWYIGMRNEKTRAALLGGNRVPADVIQKGIGMLTSNQEALADAIGADFEQNFPRFRDAFIDIFNTDLPGESFYVPMVRLMVSYETREEQVAMELTGRAGVRKQFIARNPSYARLEMAEEHQKAIRTDLMGLWMEGVRTQEGFIHQDKMVKRLHSILESDQVRYAVQQKYGPSANKWISKYINDLAQAEAYESQTGLEKFCRLARTNAAISWLAFNLLTNLKQLTGVTNFLADAGPIHLTSAGAQYVAGKGKSLLKGKFLNNTLVDFVDERTELLFNRRISQEFEDLRRLNSNLYQSIVKKIGSVGMKSLEIIDKVTVYTGWKAVYDKVMAKTGIEAEAIEAADKAVIRTQPSHRVQDMAEMYRVGEFFKWFTMFTSELSVTWNRLTFDVPMAIKRGELFHAVGDMVSFGLIGLGIAVASGALQGDEEKKKEKVVAGLFSQFIEAIPLFGNDIFAGISGKQFGYGGVRIYPALQFLDQVPKQVAEEMYDKAAINLLRGAAFAVGLPVSGPQRAVKTVMSGELRDLLGWPKEAE